MDDWGTSIWDAPIDATVPKPPVAQINSLSLGDVVKPEAESSPALDDFDDFGTTAPPPEGGDDFENDFGDFGDVQDSGGRFDEDGTNLERFQEADRIEEVVPQQVATWEPLRLDPLPPPTVLAEQVQDILAPLWGHINSEEVMTGEGIRQVDGLGQILVTPDSRAVYQTLFNVSPTTITRPPDWTRSRIRRQHLITLGIPINLDEVMPRANGKPLPTLNITTRPSSAPPGPRTVPPSNPPSGSNTRAGTPRPGTPQLSARMAQSPSSGLGPKPKLNEARIAEMLDLNTDSLALLPLSTLESHLNTLRTLTSDTSSLLTYLLQAREALEQDSETYNKLIGELVGEAQKMKTGPKSKTTAGRRGSGLL